jgi:hypothetical protein
VLEREVEGVPLAVPLPAEAVLLGVPLEVPVRVEEEVVPV